MKLNDLLNGEFTDWDFIEPKGENENLDNLASGVCYIDFNAYDDIEDARLIKENDGRVIAQWDHTYFKPKYQPCIEDYFLFYYTPVFVGDSGVGPLNYSMNNDHYDDVINEQWWINDVYVIAQWDDDYFEQFMWDKYLNYFNALGFDKYQIERRL